MAGNKGLSDPATAVRSAPVAAPRQEPPAAPPAEPLSAPRAEPRPAPKAQAPAAPVAGEPRSLWGAAWLLVRGALLGLLYVMFLPFIGLALLAWALGRSIYTGLRGAKAK